MDAAKGLGHGFDEIFRGHEIELPRKAAGPEQPQGVFLETAHPAKFKDTVENIIGEAVQIPEKLQAFMRGEKKSLPMSKDFADFKRYLMNV